MLNNPNPTKQTDAGEQQATTWFEQQTVLPNDMKNTLPFGNKHRWINWLFDRVLCRIYSSVLVEQTTIEEKVYFRVSLTAAWRKHTFYLTPLSAYMHGNALMVLNKMGMAHDVYVEGAGNSGVIYIPKWAHSEVFKACASIIKEHEALLTEQVAFLKSLWDTDKPTQVH